MVLGVSFWVWIVLGLAAFAPPSFASIQQRVSPPVFAVGWLGSFAFGVGITLSLISLLSGLE